MLHYKATTLPRNACAREMLISTSCCTLLHLSGFQGRLDVEGERHARHWQRSLDLPAARNLQAVSFESS